MSAANKKAKSRKGRHTRRPKRDGNTAKIIAGCVSYLAAAGGASRCFDGDSTSDSTHAAAVSAPLIQEGYKVLARLCDMEATTAAALRSKSRVASSLIEDSHERELKPNDFVFLSTFLNEAAAFLAPLAKEDAKAA